VLCVSVRFHTVSIVSLLIVLFNISLNIDSSGAVLSLLALCTWLDVLLIHYHAIVIVSMHMRVCAHIHTHTHIHTD
jgi:hypothetical protein